MGVVGKTQVVIKARRGPPQSDIEETIVKGTMRVSLRVGGARWSLGLRMPDLRLVNPRQNGGEIQEICPSPIDAGVNRTRGHIFYVCGRGYLKKEKEWKKGKESRFFL